MEAATDYLADVFNGIRSSQVNTNFLAFIKVSIENDFLPLEHIALVSLSGNTCLKVEPFSKDWAMPVEKAINDSKLGVTTDRHKDIIFVRLPTLSRETKEKYAKIAKEAAEKQKIAVRNIRREARNNNCDEKSVEQLTKTYIDQIDQMLVKKTKELLG